MEKPLAYRIVLAATLFLWLDALGFLLPFAKVTIPEITRDEKTIAQPVAVASPCDFVAFWTVGKMAARGQASNVYDIGRVFPLEAANKYFERLQLPWVYPPTGLLLPYLIQSAAFLPALVIWCFGMSLISAACLRSAGLAWPVVLAGCCSPSAMLNFGLGQLGILTGAIFIAGLLLVPTKSIRAALLFALLTIKPQAAVIVPVTLIAQRKWVSLLAGAACALILCGVTEWLFGVAVWRQFLTKGMAIARFMQVQPFPSGKLPNLSSYEIYGTSVLWMLRSFGFSLALASGGQMLCAAVAFLVCWRAWRIDTANSMARIALTACLGLIASPYGYLYDLCGVSVALAALAWQEGRLRVSDALVWTWPVIGLAISMRLRLELTPLALAFAGHRCWRALNDLLPGSPETGAI